MKLRPLALLLAFALTPGVAAAADPTATAVAQAHVAAIAKGDAATLIGQYRPDAWVWWVGGALDGSYTGPVIGDLWKKFAATPRALTPTVTSLVQFDNPKGSTITADVTYAGTGPNGPISLHVFHTLLIRDGKIQDEIWQVVPAPPK